MNSNMNNKNKEEYKRPDFLFRAVTVFLVAVLIILAIVMIGMTDDLKKENDQQKEKLDKIADEVESLNQKLNRDMSTDEAMIEAAKDLGLHEGDAQIFEFPTANSGNRGSN